MVGAGGALCGAGDSVVPLAVMNVRSRRGIAFRPTGNPLGHLVLAGGTAYVLVAIELHMLLTSESRPTTLGCLC